MTLLNRPGEQASAALLVSIASGLVVAYQYEAADPFVSSVAIEAVLPFGAFWRALHFWSSQAFFILLAIHAWKSLEDVGRKGDRQPGGGLQWVLLSCTLPMALFALFTGYVLRWDGTGQAAGTIAEHLLLEIPLAGRFLNRLLMAVSEEGLTRVYVVHLLLTAVLWGMGTWYHTRRVILKWPVFRDVFLGTLATAVFLRAPIDLPDEFVSLIKGPWFFLGIQELLRHLPALLAGVAYPLTPFVLYAAMPFFKKPGLARGMLAFWFSTYCGATLAGWMR